MAERYYGAIKVGNEILYYRCDELETYTNKLNKLGQQGALAIWTGFPIGEGGLEHRLKLVQTLIK